MNIEYTKVGDYYFPNLVAPENMKNFRLGKYGKLSVFDKLKVVQKIG